MQEDLLDMLIDAEDKDGTKFTKVELIDQCFTLLYVLIFPICGFFYMCMNFLIIFLQRSWTRDSVCCVFCSGILHNSP